MAQADYSSLSASVNVRVQLKDLSVTDRRAMFNALLMDDEVCPGRVKLRETDVGKTIIEETYRNLDQLCGWKGGK